MNGNNKRKAKAAKAAALVMTLMLTASTLLMSGCGEDTTSTGADSGDKSAVTWEYVAPSDLQGDTAETDADTDAKTDTDADANTDANAKADTDTEAKSEGQAPPSGEAPSGQPPEKPDRDMQAQGPRPVSLLFT